MSSHYSPDFKQSIVQQVLMPGGLSIMAMSEKTGVHHSSIRNWIQAHAKTPGMKKSKEWTPQSKLEAIIKTDSLNENQLGEYLRANGLHRAMETRLLWLSEGCRPS